VYTAAYTGLRFGELAALRVADLNLLRREVTVARSISESGGMVESGPKTNAGRRTLKLPVPIVDLLAAHLVDHRWDLVFPGVEGRPLRGSTFRQRHFDPAVRRSGLGPLTPHDLRHTHASWLIAAGEHPKVIQARLGHSSITVTLDTYGHLMAGLDEGAADKLGASFADSARRPSLAK
jgi:integrase